MRDTADKFNILGGTYTNITDKYNIGKMMGQEGFGKSAFVVAPGGRWSLGSQADGISISGNESEGRQGRRKMRSYARAGFDEERTSVPLLLLLGREDRRGGGEPLLKPRALVMPTDVQEDNKGRRWDGDCLQGDGQGERPRFVHAGGRLPELLGSLGRSCRGGPRMARYSC